MADVYEQLKALSAIPPGDTYELLEAWRDHKVPDLTLVSDGFTVYMPSPFIVEVITDPYVVCWEECCADQSLWSDPQYANGQYGATAAYLPSYGSWNDGLTWQDTENWADA